LLVFIFCCEHMLMAQDPHFSQYYATPLHLAPSFAGSSPQKTRIGANYRIQWPELTNAFNTYSIAFDHYLSKIRSGLGLLILRDQAGEGALSLTNIGFQYAFDFQINREFHIRPGLYFYYTQRTVNFSNLVFYDQLIDEGSGSSTIVTPTENLKGDVDVAISLLTYHNMFWFGTTVDHLMRANQSLYGEVSPTPVKTSIFGGVKFLVKERLIRVQEESITATFLYKNQGQFSQLDIGTYYYKNPLMLGIWYRGIPFGNKTYPGSDALAFMLGYKLDQISIGYSYDYTISKLRTNTGGAHEISLIYHFKIPTWERKPTSIPCPSF
jgi:type IX secretion system PorP/SprF family membrane protein